MKQRPTHLAVATMLAVGVSLAPASAAFGATTTCDAYSHKCSTVKGVKVVKPPAVLGDKTTLPFTGAEIVLMTTVAGGALGAGMVLVAAGRRRRASASA
jgi:hypothetical protein